ncbi:MAG: hypothetical protein UV82_C0010G0027 [Candidatus Magasanikbacteria bacterium GW2011_GWD2_43_18]|uniref:YdbS-like PH domain-containing protein n=1 Tax=Candidatus Magasanikbacteria bacterium GW2011_GWE2_42_7 TaxID=1619052 RepID=A0A0G1BES1_9BACT|nr:MAG: hypothetical protein UV18_C0005G0157 [Candidatus Magasanikbacteria bacterium GW2011_GWC2_42_27]KKS71792.1 MAG: hypothetical protein UV42_C0019G0016 [Candidatus Magasanikbacteria bacterium GW2011_GWE2_42_7]KKT04211.1 MAG: hypothetical protein UV82_C0010G0027 [Candidatus Magasanikbacteria bacterium GW2011_GWD2_43_18]KKT25905.1 MAG: hypothetical protein UW10_C0003G0066 [Candidatus Magasanikbacteria bacterium GW2011_GWA2_43_9]HBB37882.1 hypothetical protein [Candidatus Magasanikbacteria bac
MHLRELIKQKSYEHVVHEIRRHPITFVPIAFLFLVLLLVPIVLYLVLLNLFPAVLAGPRTYPLLVLLASSYYLTMYLLFYVRFIDYYLDIWIVTNDRIIDIEQHNLFSRSITELDLFRIQDVTVEMHGLFATVFNYGDVSVKTASSNSHIVFYAVGYPNKIREDLIKLSEEDRKYHLGIEDEL